MTITQVAASCAIQTCTEGSNPFPSATQSEPQRKSALLPPKYAKEPVFRDCSQTNRTAQNGLLGSEGGHCHGFSLEGTFAVRF
jgi:hypothetical protein